MEAEDASAERRCRAGAGAGAGPGAGAGAPSAQVLRLLQFRFTPLGATLRDAFCADGRCLLLPDEFAADVFAPLYAPVWARAAPQPPEDWGHDCAPADDTWRVEGGGVEWVSVSAGRNVRGSRFTPSMTPSDLDEVRAALVAALHRLPAEFAGEYVPLAAVPQARLDALEAQGLLRTPLEGGRQWPLGRGVWLGHDFAVWVNVEDHATVCARASGGDVRGALRRVGRAARALDALLPAARHPRAGLLAARAERCGSALAAEAGLRPRPPAPPRRARALAHALGLRLRAPGDGRLVLRMEAPLGCAEARFAQRFALALGHFVRLLRPGAAAAAAAAAGPAAAPATPARAGKHARRRSKVPSARAPGGDGARLTAGSAGETPARGAALRRGQKVEIEKFVPRAPKRRDEAAKTPRRRGRRVVRGVDESFAELSPQLLQCH